MAIRNFWVEADIDGRQTTLAGGPRGKTSGMEVTLYQREEGSIATAIRIACRALSDGKLATTVYINDVFAGRFETAR